MAFGGKGMKNESRGGGGDELWFRRPGGSCRWGKVSRICGLSGLSE